jgi:hypothetical protein
MPTFGRYKLLHHEATKSFKNCNELLFLEMDTWRVLVLTKIQNNKLCNESALENEHVEENDAKELVPLVDFEEEG